MSRVWLDGWPRWRRRRGGSGGGDLVPYNLWVSPSLTSEPDDLHLPAGLSVEEAVRIADAITASQPSPPAPSTAGRGASGNAGAPHAAWLRSLLSPH